jgi:hypothetical protein
LSTTLINGAEAEHLQRAPAAFDDGARAGPVEKRTALLHVSGDKNGNAQKVKQAYRDRFAFM